MIKGVTFDFGKTLAMGDLDRKEFSDRLSEYARSLGFSEGRARLEKARKTMFERLLKVRDVNRELRIEEFYEGLLFGLKIHPSKEVIDHIHQLYADSFKTELAPHAREVLQILEDKYKLAVVSNAMSQVPRLSIRSLGLECFFDTIVISRDLGIRKPDPEIFRFALNNLGIESNEAIHVGDSLEYDVQGAKNAGMKVIWIRNKREQINVVPDHTVNSLREIIPLL